MTKQNCKRLITLLPLVTLLLVGCHKNESTPRPDNPIKTIEIYATNDFHGAIQEDGDHMGLAKMATYLKQKGDQPNTLLIDQGDGWQGSIYSNYNHGALVTDVMNYIHYDARSVGNHDFDWGVDYVVQNTARSYQGYSVPVLAGNVYDYNFDTKTIGNVQQSNIGIKSVTYTLDNGLKVGILGGIGEDQITSICSLYTKEICFTDHIQFIKDEATHLRNDEKCDVIIVSIHTGQESVKDNGLENYVDLVLCGHTHREEYSHEGSLYYSQNQAYGQSLGHITLGYDTRTKAINKTYIQSVSAKSVINSITTIDSGVNSIVNSYNSQCKPQADVVMASNVSGEFYGRGAMANLMCKAIYDECIAAGHDDVLLTYANEARTSKYSGTWTYEDIYESFPFDNVVYIAEITGAEFKHEVKRYNYIYRSSSFTDTTIIDTNTYKIAVIDYVYFHTGTDRNYDYFYETGGTSSIALSKNYREIIRDWLLDNGYNTGKPLRASDYDSSLWQHSRSQLPS